jgi:hypothetical protein
MAAHALKAHPDIGLNMFHHMAKMDAAVGVGECAGNKYLAGHGFTLH